MAIFGRAFPIRGVSFGRLVVASAQTVSAALAATEAADTAAFAASSLTTAALAATEAADVAAFAGQSITTGALASTETPDAAAFSAQSITSGALATTETADTAAVAAQSLTSAALATTDGADTASFNALDQDTAILDATESADTASFAAQAVTSATVSATESADIADFAATIDAVNASFALVESSDIIAFSATTAAAASEASGSWSDKYSARRFYALREKIEREREELRLAIAELERKKRQGTLPGKDGDRANVAANVIPIADYRSGPLLGEGIDVTEFAREIAAAAHSAARLKQMETELALAAQMLEDELQDEDDLILALAV